MAIPDTFYNLALILNVLNRRKLLKRVAYKSRPVSRQLANDRINSGCLIVYRVCLVKLRLEVTILNQLVLLIVLNGDISICVVLVN